jgi:predicted AlkP superfamily pyrophosphatase or phosphodiesterase
MQPLIVLNVVGLSPKHIGPDTPNLATLANRGAMRPLTTVTPAVTCTVQSTLLTGLRPDQHGAVANGWFFENLGEIFFWRQSARLISGERVWEAARRYNPDFTCANLFWWYAMHNSADISVTPRPMYLADGRKIPDCWAAPVGLREELTQKLRSFPLFSFWGPATSIKSSQWIADCALHVRRTRAPTLTLVYLPHLDYDLQRLGPNHPQIKTALREVDAVCGILIEDATRDGAKVIVLSEYGITPVSTPIHVNRALRQSKWLEVRTELGGEHLDLAASAAFAVADHQIAHVYVRRKELTSSVAAVLRELDGVEAVFTGEERGKLGLDHPRSGDLVALARADAWFTYYHWLDDADAPDYARTVDIHRKPGYDPVELFLDPAIRFPKLTVGWRLAKRKLGFRTMMDVIPLNAALVKGSHGRVTDDPADGPVLISSDAALLPDGALAATEVKNLILDHVFARNTRHLTREDRHHVA